MHLYMQGKRNKTTVTCNCPDLIVPECLFNKIQINELFPRNKEQDFTIPVFQSAVLIFGQCLTSDMQHMGQDE